MGLSHTGSQRTKYRFGTARILTCRPVCFVFGCCWPQLLEPIAEPIFEKSRTPGPQQEAMPTISRALSGHCVRAWERHRPLATDVQRCRPQTMRRTSLRRSLALHEWMLPPTCRVNRTLVSELPAGPSNTRVHKPQTHKCSVMGAAIGDSSLRNLCARDFPLLPTELEKNRSG